MLNELELDARQPSRSTGSGSELFHSHWVPILSDATLAWVLKEE